MQRFKSWAKSLRAAQTCAEAKLWRALRNRRLARWKFRRQHPVEQYVVDFVTLEGRLVVEVDGMTHDDAGAKAHDAVRTRVLENCGFHVLRVNNVDVFDNIDGVLDLIASTLPSKDSPLTRPLRGRPLPDGERGSGSRRFTPAIAPAVADA